MTAPQRAAAIGSTGRPRPIARRRVGAGLVIAGVALFGAACTGSNSTPSSSSSPTVAQTLPGSAAAPSTGGGVGTPSGVGTKSGAGTGSAPSSQGPTTYPALPSSSGPAPKPQRTNPPVAITRTGAFGGQISGTITKVRAITAKAKLPGEVSGPALAISIQLFNRSAKAITIADSVVTLGYGPAQTPGSPMSAPPSDPFVGSLKAGKSATAVYVFRIAKSSGQPRLTIEVSYSPSAPIIAFYGTAR